MPHERFIIADVLPPEVMDRIQRKLRSMYHEVQNDPQQSGTLTVRFVVRANGLTDVDGEYTIESRFADRMTSEVGKIRDGQLVLPGTGVRSDDPPPNDWKAKMLGAPDSISRAGRD